MYCFTFYKAQILYFSWKTIVCRIFVNLSVLFLLSLSAYIVIEIVARSTQPEANSNWWRQNEITVIMSLINYIFPIFFEILGILENYHPRKQLRLQLARYLSINFKFLNNYVKFHFRKKFKFLNLQNNGA